MAIRAATEEEIKAVFGVKALQLGRDFRHLAQHSNATTGNLSLKSLEWLSLDFRIHKARSFLGAQTTLFEMSAPLRSETLQFKGLELEVTLPGTWVPQKTEFALEALELKRLRR